MVTTKKRRAQGSGAYRSAIRRARTNARTTAAECSYVVEQMKHATESARLAVGEMKQLMACRADDDELHDAWQRAALYLEFSTLLGTVAGMLQDLAQQAQVEVKRCEDAEQAYRATLN